MAGDLGELPELVRVFFFGPSQRRCDDCYGNRSQSQNSFDYLAATDLLKKHPEQVEYVAFECQPRRKRHRSFIGSREEGGSRDNNGAIDRSKEDNSNPNQGDDDSRRSFAATGINNPFLHSPIRWACIETEATKEAEAMEFLRTIRAINPTMFLIQDRYGDLPIDGECILNASTELISFLLEIYLEYDFECLNGVRMTENNFNPITCLCGSFWWEDVRKAHEDIVSGRYNVSGSNVLEDNLGIDDNFWKKIILLAKAFYHKTIQDVSGERNKKNQERNHDENRPSTPSILRITNQYVNRTVEFRLLHACAGIDWFPPNLLRLLVAAFPNALLERDEDGNLPIHVAAGSSFESYKMHDYHDSDGWLGDFEANSGYQKTTIDTLLQANPLLAQMTDGKQRFPLELAIESNLEPSDLIGSMQTRWRPWEDGGISSLLEAFPVAAKIRSPVTGKLPLEITLSSGSYRDWNDGVEILLKAYPEAASLKNPRTGKYPLQLAIECETHCDDGVYGLIKASPKSVLECVSAAPASPKTRSLRTIRNGRLWRYPGVWERAPMHSEARPSKKTRSLPLFAHAALENCSTSVVYKLLRMNPQTCREYYEPSVSPPRNNRHKRKLQGGNNAGQIMLSFASKRLKRTKI